MHNFFPRVEKKRLLPVITLRSGTGVQELVGSSRIAQGDQPGAL